MIIQKNFFKMLFKGTFKRPIPKTYSKDLFKRPIQKNYSILHIQPRYFAFTANPLAMFKFKVKNLVVRTLMFDPFSV